jgi:hypothetical protein
MSVYVTPEQHRRLHRLHEQTQIPIAVLVRNGIDLVLKKGGV